MNKIVLSKRQDFNQEINIKLNSSKSISNRLLIIRFLSKNHQKISNLSNSDDTVLLKNFLNQIENQTNNHFYCKNAGTTTRFLIALLSITKGTWIVDADDRMNERPILPLINILNSLGADISQKNEDKIFPIIIKGKELASREDIFFNNSLTSQIISALLLISPYIKNGLIINLPQNQPSMPYIDMTLSLANKYGAKIKKHDNKLICSTSHYDFHQTIVEQDWSSACFFYALTCVGQLKNIFINSLQTSILQGDYRIKDIYETLGVQTKFLPNGTLLSYDKSLLSANKIITFDLCGNPDVFPALAVTCFLLNKNFEIKNLHTLCFKESNRLKNITQEINKIEKRCKIVGDNFIVEQGQMNTNQKLEICSYDDHRIAMAMSIMALVLNEITIDNKDCVQKSYPNFWADIANIFYIQ